MVSRSENVGEANVRASIAAGQALRAAAVAANN